MPTASIFRRILAYLIDCIFVFIVFVVVLKYALFVPRRHPIISSEDWFKSGWNTEAYTLLTISFPTWLYFILTEISSWKATLGKRLLKIQTLGLGTMSGMSPIRSIVRTLIKLLPWELAHITNNLPTPMWYTENPGFRLGTALIPLLVIAYLLITSLTRCKQGPHDLAANTMVVFSG